MSKRKIDKIEDFEFEIDSRYKSKKENEKESAALMKARSERMQKLTKEEILRARLMQLKLKMDNYLKNSSNQQQISFTEFLTIYIDTIYTKRINFAEDINVSPNYLSKVINRHREPKEEFMLKLIIHSEKVFENISNFSRTTWYELYYHEKLNELMKNQNKWKPKIAKQIKISELI